MSRSARRVDQASGYVLHQRPFRDTSLIVELFARDFGRLTSFARGARGAKPRFFGLRPFLPLWLSWAGRGEAPQLTAAEPRAAVPPLPPDNLLSGFYLNELLMKLTGQHDPHPEVFDQYEQALQQLRAGSSPEPVLRRFERQLLTLLGYGLELTREAGSGRPVRADGYYRHEPGLGVVAVPPGTAEALSGRVLLCLAVDEECIDEADQRAARALMRGAVDHCLDGRPLATRTVARSLARMEHRE